MEVLNLGKMTYLIQGTFPCFLCAVFLIFFIYFDNSMTRITQKLFMLATLSVIFLSLSECFEHYFHYKHILRNVCQILAAASYAFRIAAVGFTASITQRTRIFHKNLIYAGIAVNALIACISIPTGCIFSLTSDFKWLRGPLYCVPYIIAIWYSLVLIISSFMNYKTNKKEAFLIIAGTALGFFANIIEIITPWKFILSFAFMTYICFYFLCLNVQLYRRDAMTSLLNRRSFFLDANRFSDHSFSIISLDLNDLKIFNDQEGHSAGDTALCTVANCMKSAFGRAGFCYRTGGDEFMVIITEKYTPAIDKYINNFKLKLSKTEYSVALGYDTYNPGDDIDSIIEKADLAMYRNKRFMKGKD